MWGLLLSALLALNPIAQRLLESKKEINMPVQSVTNVAYMLRLQFHDRDDIAMADYISSGAGRPTLLLYRPYYERNGQLIPIRDMVVDSSEYLFSSLLTAYLDLLGAKNNPQFMQFLKSRAPQVMTDVPPQYQVEAFRNALISFAASSYSIAIQAERTRRKHGPKICDVIDRPQSIFTLWENNFHDHAAFQGYYYKQTGPNQGEWVESKKVPTRSDKEAFIAAILEGYWKGDRNADFKSKYSECQ